MTLMAGLYPETVEVDELAALMALLKSRPEGMSWPEITARVLEVGSASELWGSLRQPSLLEDDELQEHAAELEEWNQRGFQVVSVLDERYPARLRGVHQAPPVLFARGELLAEDRAVSVVGSRNASERGVQMASSIAEALVDAGLTVVSGLAVGIDAAAHRAALQCGGRTVALIATGIERAYPAANKGLQEEIAARGLLLSQFWPAAPPQKHNFLMRNATMSGYGWATIVVEAGEKSGARAQARMAVEHGRPVILSDLVVERNEWARALLERPGVHVAGGLAEVMAVIRGILSENARVEAALRSLVSA